MAAQPPLPAYCQPADVFAFDARRGDYRCLLCNAVADPVHCRATKHTNWAGWWVTTPPHDPERMEWEAEIRRRRAALLQPPPPPGPPGILVAHPGQPEEEQELVTIRIPRVVATRLIELLIEAVNNQPPPEAHMGSRRKRISRR